MLGESVVKFNVINLTKPDSLFAMGMRPVLYSHQDAAEKGLGWRRCGHGIDYRRYGHASQIDARAQYSLSWWQFRIAERGCVSVPIERYGNWRGGGYWCLWRASPVVAICIFFIKVKNVSCENEDFGSIVFRFNTTGKRSPSTFMYAYRRSILLSKFIAPTAASLSKNKSASYVAIDCSSTRQWSQIDPKIVLLRSIPVSNDV